MSASPVIQIPFRPDLQGLRALAVTLVILAHLDLGAFAGGFIGVDVFFVLSGYLITRILVFEFQESGRIRYGRFWVRRLRRLYPALVSMLFVTFLSACLLLGSQIALVQTASLGYAATWTSNLYFAFAEFDYFSRVADKDLFLHTWSLGVEEQFYLAWPFVLAAGLFLARNAKGSSTRATILVGVLLLVASVGMLAVAIGAEQRPLLSFYLMPARMIQFATGALVFMVSERLDKPGEIQRFLCDKRFVSGALLIIGLLLVVGSAWVISPHVKYPNVSAFFPTVGTALVILGGATLQQSRLICLMTNRPTVWVGDRSYSIYLWHWPVFQLAREYQLLASPSAVVAAVAVALSLATLSYKWIERPYWKGTLKVVPTLRFVSVSAVIAVAAVGTSSVASRIANPSAEDLRAGSGYNPRSDLPPFYALGKDCDTWTGSADLRPCVVAGEGAGKTVLLVGYSIGAQWVSALPEIFAPANWESIVLTKSACPIVDREYFYEAIGDVYTICSEWRDSAIDYIVERRPEIVIIGSSSHYDFSADEWTEGLDRVVTRLNEAVGSVVLLAATPTVSVADPRCALSSTPLTRLAKVSIPDCGQLLADSRGAQVTAYLRTVADRYSNVQVLDLVDLVCPDQQCTATTDAGIKVFRDNRHLTNRFVHTLVPQIRQRMAELDLPDLTTTLSAAKDPS